MQDGSEYGCENCGTLKQPHLHHVRLCDACSPSHQRLLALAAKLSGGAAPEPARRTFADGVREGLELAARLVEAMGDCAACDLAAEIRGLAKE